MGAEMSLEEVKMEKPFLEEELGTAQYNFDRANDRQSYNDTFAELERVQERWNNLLEKETKAQADLEAADIEGLTTALNEARQARLDQAKFLKDNANIDVDEYDPEQGPPGLPEEPAAAGSGTSTTDGGSGTSTDGSSTTSTDGSSTDGSSTDGGSG